MLGITLCIVPFYWKLNYDCANSIPRRGEEELGEVEGNRVGKEEEMERKKKKEKKKKTKNKIKKLPVVKFATL